MNHSVDYKCDISKKIIGKKYHLLKLMRVACAYWHGHSPLAVYRLLKKESTQNHYFLDNFGREKNHSVNFK